MAQPRVRLDAPRVFWRVALALFVLRELYAWSLVCRRVPARRPLLRLLFFLLWRRATPGSVFYAVVVGGVLTLLAALVVRLVVGPLVAYWHAPRTDSVAGEFHLGANERVVASSPARRRPGRGRHWPSGMLVRTNLRLWFFPNAHDAEIWSCPLAALEDVHAQPAPPIARGMIRNWPDRFALRDGDGVPEVFAVPDARAPVLAHARPGPGAAEPGPVAEADVEEGCLPDGKANPGDCKELAMLTVVITDFLEEATVETPILQDVAQVVLAGAHSEEELAGFLPDADALIVFHDIAQLGAATFSKAPRCQCVVRAGVGYNNIDREAAARFGVVVCNVPDYGTEEVADHALMFLLTLVRRLLPLHESIRAGGWDYRPMVGAPRLRGKTLGLVGCGRIGTATALRAKAFGLDVLFYDPFVPQGADKALGVRRAHRLEELLEQSHFVSIHCYLDESTHHLIDGRALARMRPGALLINTARGPIVDQAALLEALDSGRLAGAALDVVEREPLDDDRLRTHPRVLLTPHAAFYSVESFVELRTKAAEEVRRILLGEAPRNPITSPSLANI